LNKSKSKNASAERHKWTKAEREYVKGIIHNYSFQRWTAQEIVQWLHDEKKIDIGRSTVNRIKNQMDRDAEKWYIELKQSTFKYIAVYKERIDSLFSYQKKLHEIISATKKPEVQIRAISELHSIEMSIFSLWKQLPDLQMDDSRGNRNEYEYDNVGRNGLPRAISYGPEEDERQDRAEFFGWKHGDSPLDSRFRAMMEQKYGLEYEPWDKETWVDCSGCKRWFKNPELLRTHAAICPEPIV
jgi:hypothetical protein